MMVCAGALAAMSFADVVTPASLLALTFGLGLGSAAHVPRVPGDPTRPGSAARVPSGVRARVDDVQRRSGRRAGHRRIRRRHRRTRLGVPAQRDLVPRDRRSPGVVAPARRRGRSMPAETFSGAMRAGLRYAVHSPNLRGVLNRTALFCLPGSRAPGVAADRGPKPPRVEQRRLRGAARLLRCRRGVSGGRSAHGSTIASTTTNSCSGRRSLWPAALVVEGISRIPWVIGVAMLVGGLAWATALTSTGVASFSALPEWVRARGMGLYMLVLAGAIAIGSAAWGVIAAEEPDHGAPHRRRCHGPDVGDRALAGGSAPCRGSTSAWSLRTTRRSRWSRTRPTGRCWSPSPTRCPVTTCTSLPRRCDSSSDTAGALAHIDGGCSVTSPLRISSSRHSSWSRGASTCANTGAPPSMPDRFLDPVRRYLGTSAVVVTHYLSVYSPSGRDQTGDIDPEPL